MASDDQIYDLSCVNSRDRSQAIMSRLIRGLKIERRENFLGLQLGHFITFENESDRDQFCRDGEDRTISHAQVSPQKKMACELFPKIQIQFEADGESANGEKRSLEIEASCQITTNLNVTDTIWIPWGQLASETPFEGESKYSKPTPLSLKVRNVTEAWPQKWILSRISLLGPRERLDLEQSKIEGIAKRPFVFEFR